MQPKKNHILPNSCDDNNSLTLKTVHITLIITKNRQDGTRICTIAFPDFEKVANYYNDYIDDVPGIKQKMRNEVGYNTQYILTLIHHVLI